MDDAKRHPATYLLTASWILVYLAMIVLDGGFSFGGGMDMGKVSTRSAHLFGSVSAREVADGQIWRTVTATFIHTSLLHLIFNLTCLFSFGRLLESWYGWGQLLFVYVVIGALGNGFAVAGRFALKAGTDVPCAGGSSVMFGFIALIAVVGWRSKTRFGDYVRRQMMGKLLVFGVVIGVMGRGVLDNFGHAGGALAGAIVGLGHRNLLRGFDRPIGRTLGFVAIAALGLCFAAQGRVARSEVQVMTRIDRQQQILQLIRSTSSQYASLARIAELGNLPPDSSIIVELRDGLRLALNSLNSIQGNSSPGGNLENYRTWRALAEAAALRFPTAEENLAFRKLSTEIFLASSRDLATLVESFRRLGR